MTNREKTLVVLIILATINIIVFTIALIVKNQENEKYKAILEVACQKSYAPTQCDASLDLMMDMSPEKIRNYGKFGF